MADIRSVAAPNLPLAPAGYDRKWQEQFSNALRLYFTALNNAVNDAIRVPKDRVELTDGVIEPAVPGGRVYLYVDQVDGDLKIKFSDGTIKTIITD